MRILARGTVTPDEGGNLPADVVDIGGGYYEVSGPAMLPPGLEVVAEGSTRFTRATLADDADDVLHGLDFEDGEIVRKRMADIAGGEAPPEWTYPVFYPLGSVVMHLGIAYEIIQPHTSQAGWAPPIVPALWKVTSIGGAIPTWTQPLGAHDAYALGARVDHGGQTWISTIPANVWEPGATTEVLWLPAADLRPHAWFTIDPAES